MVHDVDTIGDAKVQTKGEVETVRITLEFDRNTGEPLNVLDQNGRPLLKRDVIKSWPMHDTIIGIQRPHTHGPQPRSCCPDGKPHYYWNGYNICP
jgi:hypothetical protein